MGDSKWILRVFLQISLLPLITALECHSCSDMEIISRSKYQNNDVISHLAPGLRDSRCRKKDSVYNYNNNNNNYDRNKNQFNNQNGAFSNTQLHSNQCPAARPGSREVVRCGVWQGNLNATVFEDIHLVFRTFSFGCINLAPDASYGCHERTTDAKDKNYFQNVLFGTFQANVQVNFFRGTLCLCDGAECQLTSGTSRAQMNMAVIVLLVLLCRIVSTKLLSVN